METEEMMACLLAEIRISQEHMKEMMNEMKDKIKKDIVMCWVCHVTNNFM
jgi:hypothetical protein